MKNSLPFLFAVMLLMSFFPTIHAQTITLDGELRPRTEYRHGYKTLPPNDEADAAFFTSQRSRLNFGYDNQKIKVGISLQDIRTWGDVPQLNSSDSHLGVHQAWGEIALCGSFGLKVGRQELVYDDQRIFGNVGWAQQARSHDIAVLKFHRDDLFTAHLGAGFNQDSERLFGTEYTTPSNYKTMQYIWAHKDFDQIGVSFLVLNNGLQYIEQIGEDEFETETVFSQTIGTYAKWKQASMQAHFSAYFQTGKDSRNESLAAYYLAASIGKQINEELTATLGIERLSGTDDKDRSSSDYKNKSFTPFYGTNHKFNGHMDYFYVGNHGNNVGLNDLYANLLWKTGKFSNQATIHLFSSAAEVINRQDFNETLDNWLGAEVDLSVGYTVNKQAKVNVGFSMLFASETMEAIKNGVKDEGNNWAWIMIQFKPKFL